MSATAETIFSTKTTLLRDFVSAIAEKVRGRACMSAPAPKDSPAPFFAKVRYLGETPTTFRFAYCWQICQH